MGAPDSSAPPDSSSGTFEKWLVRIFLALAFGLAFGIEGMTIIRSYFVDGESTQTESTADRPPTLDAGQALVPAAGPTVRVRRLRVQATDTAWTFSLTARPDTALAVPYTISFDRLDIDGGGTASATPSHTWAPGDTTSFTASWALAPGRRPAALTVTATTVVPPGSTSTATRTVDVGHVPVRMQR